MPTSRGLTPLRMLVVVAACAMTACGSGGGSIVATGDPVPIQSPAANDPSASDPSASDPPGGSACSLLTQQDLDALGIAVELGDGANESDTSSGSTGAPTSVCGWNMSSDAEGGMKSWTFRITVRSGSDSGGFEEVAADTFMETEPEEVPGLGDAATYQQDIFLSGPDLENRVAVLSGSDVVPVENLEESMLAKDTLIEVTRLVVERLGAA